MLQARRASPLTKNRYSKRRSGRQTALRAIRLLPHTQTWEKTNQPTLVALQRPFYCKRLSQGVQGG